MSIQEYQHLNLTKQYESEINMAKSLLKIFLNDSPQVMDRALVLSVKCEFSKKNKHFKDSIRLYLTIEERYLISYERVYQNDAIEKYFDAENYPKFEQACHHLMTLAKLIKGKKLLVLPFYAEALRCKSHFKK